MPYWGFVPGAVLLLLATAATSRIVVIDDWSYAGKRVVDRLPERVFVVVIEGTMTAAGLLFLIRG